MREKNPLLKILNQKDFFIPVYLSDDARASYIHQLKAKFYKIEKFFKKHDEVHFEPANKENILIKVSGIQAELIRVIDEYLKGFPAKAYILFSKMLDDYGVGNEIKSAQQYRVERNSTLYRSQKQYGKIEHKFRDTEGFLNTHKPGDLFHPPFQRRRSVGTNRFSISGYPCLYLSEDLTTSYSECFPNKNDYSMFNTIAFKNSRPLYFIDLSDDNLKVGPYSFGGFLGNTKDVSVLLDGLGFYHLVIATHTKIDYKPIYKGEAYHFKAEYIIPQLLLQWVKFEGYAIDGIRYKSCTSKKKIPTKRKHYNYVMPVKSANLEKGFCPELTRLFLYSPVYSYYKVQKPKSISSVLNEISRKLGSNVKLTKLT